MHRGITGMANLYSIRYSAAFHCTVDTFHDHLCAVKSTGIVAQNDESPWSCQQEKAVNAENSHKLAVPTSQLDQRLACHQVWSQSSEQH